MQHPNHVEATLALPTGTVAQHLLAIGEDQWFDRKSARIKPRALADSIIGFANAEGGVIVVGLSDGRVEGTDQLRGARNALLQASLDFCDPPVRAPHRFVRCTDDNGAANHLLVFEIAPGETSVHANARDEVFLRVGDENRRLTFAQRQELTFDRSPGYEARPLPDVAMRDLDRELLASYVEILGATSRKRLLRARGLVTGDGMINVAGGLLFARHPQAQMPEAHMRILRYHGTDRGTGLRQRIASDVRCEGPIPRMLTTAQEHVRAVQPTRRALGRGGRFEDMPLVPEDAWLEGIVNAVVHRSYSLAGDHIRVDVFDDRIEITSPGRFPGIVALDDPLEAPHFARNPRIARVCTDLQFGQQLGEGIRRIYDEMRNAGLIEPHYTQTGATVRLVLSGELVDRALDARLPPDARVITVALRDAGRLRTGEVAELIGRSRPVAIRRLRKLEEAGVVHWVGRTHSDPHAYWQLVR